MKQCSKCKKVKSFLEFNKDRNNKDGLGNWCRLCCKKQFKKYYQKNKIRLANNYKKWRENNKEHAKKLDDDWYKRNKLYKQNYSRNKQRKKWTDWKKTAPWKSTFYYIKGRCEQTYNPRYYRYGQRGIKCLITEEELKTLWFRDKAYLLDWPSIDRKNNDGNYEFNNCRYIEKRLNRPPRKAMKK